MTKLGTILKKYFQKDVKFYIDGILVKNGKFILYKDCENTNTYFYEFTLQKKDKLITYRIPYPYDIEDYEDEGLIYLDYRISTWTNKNSLIELAQAADELQENKSIFYNKILEIQFE